MKHRLLQWLFAGWQELEQIKRWLQQLTIEQLEQSKVLAQVTKQLKEITMKADEALAELQKVQANLTEIGTETDTLLQKVADLQAAAANADLPQNVADAITAVATQAQAVDDKVPDVPPAG